MVHPELDALFNALLPFAQTMKASVSRSIKGCDGGWSSSSIFAPTCRISPLEVMLREHGEFYPFGAIKKQAKKGELLAAGICYDVLTVPPGEVQKRDAVCCCLEHYWASKARHRASAGVCSMVEKKDSKRLKKMKKTS